MDCETDLITTYEIGRVTYQLLCSMVHSFQNSQGIKRNHALEFVVKSTIDSC